MRFIIYGAGGIGGTIGARLFQSGRDVLLIARGKHYEAIKRNGLTLRTPLETLNQPIPVVNHPSQIQFKPDDVVFLTMKSQHTWDALLSLRDCADSTIPVVCCQNGVDNERMALRLFRNVYAMVVVVPSNHFEPGVVECNSVESTGILDTGKYPSGVDELIKEIAGHLEASNISSNADPKPMRWKYQKLLRNLNNSLQAICEINEATRDISDEVHAEAIAVYEAAGIDYATDEEERKRRGNLLRMKPIDGQKRVGGSSWQSLKNAKGDIESDFLNGEIVLLGNLNNVPTPANQALTILASKAAREGAEPGGLNADLIRDLIQRLKQDN